MICIVYFLYYHSNVISKKISLNMKTAKLTVNHKILLIIINIDLFKTYKWQKMNGFGYKVCMMKQCHIIIPRRMTSCKVLTKFDILAHAFIIYFNLFSLSKFCFHSFFLFFPFLSSPFFFHQVFHICTFLFQAQKIKN